MNTKTQQVAIVTGASRGIGAAIAERLAADGFTVIVNYSGNQALADELVRKIEQSGGRALSARADVSDAAAVAQLFDRAEQAFGGVDILVNNAGVIALAPVAEMSDADVDRLIDINLKGTFNTLREAAKRLRDNGRIINFSSSVVGLLQPNYGMYAASKAAVEALTSVLAKELRGRNITVNAIAPGPTATGLFLDGKTPELIDRLAKMAPLERLGQPQDIAAAVSFLAGADGAWINGQTLRANGGII
ncbi:SDR family oxidoreductase [Serratia liquefaciens]|jgi:3-oxoacyl-[acyl-carrier protein] reductase|uniref:SDR family oxidoreductase n=1 Tax=Serratia liquefaciens TaxID=614 RepID=UPI0003586D0D|nr:SDR family oxidoreductase [Serratia liquefaciens]AGQ32526.1 3-ketoacyl-ACP reductase [Serratia liquefaciens ATCC 27592]CAI0998299.1 3-oxoacyl-[acyl-carrier-protein] reductase FabG [Serratia liquefaciens]CAI1165056.1 3-oxoacyl-[acyl-carrier-protein] reductase FabG [Serratia liquefaciens]CAI2025597.1 3-oxoacyl-[acyl-carrier-protein] reductase FabG [Serratia liquefaciens]CAI2399141.1 3-oxoacyl-[acyl-carrier-protein] reductase FabG [Serratia liquefaciens]